VGDPIATGGDDYLIAGQKYVAGRNYVAGQYLKDEQLSSDAFVFEYWFQRVVGPVSILRSPWMLAPIQYEPDF
jgi:hypothetical protein